VGRRGIEGGRLCARLSVTGGIQIARQNEGTAIPAICYLDGVSGPLPTLYIERSGVKPSMLLEQQLHSRPLDI